MTWLFEDLSQVNSFLIITFLLFCDWYAPTLSIWSDYKNFKDWHRRAAEKMWLPGVLFFPLLIVILYVLLDISFFAFYKNAFSYLPANDIYWIVPTITFMMLFNIVFTKQWISYHIRETGQWACYFWLVGMIATAATYLGITGFYDRWLEFGTFIPYLVFWVGALYLTIYSSYIEKKLTKEEKRAREKQDLQLQQGSKREIPFSKLS